MILSILQRMALYSMEFLLKRMNTPQNLMNVFKSLFSVSTLLITTIGIIPTISTFWRLSHLTLERGNQQVVLRQLTDVLGLDPVSSTLILNTLTEHLRDCVKFPTYFKRINMFIFIYTSLRLFRPNIFKLTRIFLGGIFSTIGILSNETLSAIEILKDSAIFFKSLLYDYFNIQLPIIASKEVVNINNDELSEIIKDNSNNWYMYAAAVVGGIITISFMLMVAEINYPDTIHNVPIVNSYVESLYSCYDSLLNWLYPNTGGGDTAPRVNIPEVISRNNSGSSGSITPRGLQTVTPPMSRSATPIVDDNFSLNNDWE